MDDKLALSVTHADGSISRWGPDEVEAQDVPTDLTFSTSCPGGFKDAGCSLLRRIDRDYPDERLFDTLRIYPAQSPEDTAWEGRMAQFPASHGQGFSHNPGAIGWAAHLRDDPTFQEVYCDRDLSSWGEMPLNERIRLAAASIDFASFSWGQADGGLQVAFPNQALGAQCESSIWYIAPGGIRVVKVGYVGNSDASPAGYSSATFRFNDDDTLTGADEESVAATLDGINRYATAAAGHKYLATGIYSNGSATTPGPGSNRRFSEICVYGDHGLTLAAISGEPDGVQGSDVLADVLSRAAPLLQYTTGVDGTIEPTGLAIAHLTFRDPVTAETVVQAVNAYYQADWAVWEDRTFYWHTPDPARLTWRARLSDGARFSPAGDDSENIYNGVYVTYLDASTGRKMTVGPPGASADATDTQLADTSEDNPVNAHGIQRRWGVLELSQPTVLDLATQVGRLWLTEKALPQRRGSITLVGQVEHPTMGLRPPWQVRAGDYITLEDRPGDVPRKIINTGYTYSDRTLVAECDNTSHKLDAILESIGGSLTGQM